MYDITVRYAGAQLMLQYKMLPWVKGGTSGVYAMDAFNVYTADPSLRIPSPILSLAPLLSVLLREIILN